MTRVFAGDVVITRRLADGKTILYPEILFHLPVKDGLGIFDAIAREVLALGDDAHARHSAMLGNVPEPSLVGNVRDGGVAFVDAFAPFRIFVVRPDRDLVEIRIAHAPAIAIGGERLLAGAIKRDRRA